jgi:hypothetical protein
MRGRRGEDPLQDCDGGEKLGEEKSGKQLRTLKVIGRRRMGKVEYDQKGTCEDLEAIEKLI